MDEKFENDDKLQYYAIGSVCTYFESHFDNRNIKRFTHKIYLDIDFTDVPIKPNINTDGPYTLNRTFSKLGVDFCFSFSQCLLKLFVISILLCVLAAR